MAKALQPGLPAPRSRQTQAGGAWIPAWARPEHPIVREEVRRWRRGRFPWFSRGGRLAAGGIFLLVLLPAACAGFAGVSNQLPRGEWIALVGGALTMTTVIASALMGWAAGLAATILGATLIAREREQHRWPYLRVTPLRSMEIVGGKLASLAYLLARPLHLAAGLRLFAVLAGVATLGLMAAASGLGPAQVSDSVALAREIARQAPLELLLAISTGATVGLAGIAYWLLEPYLTGLYSAVIGLTASTLARTRGLAIGMAFAAHLVLGVGLYWPAHQFVGLVSLAAADLFTASPADSLPAIALVFGLQFAVVVLLRTIVIAGCLTLAVQRVETLGD